MTQSEQIAEAAMESFWSHYEAGNFAAGIALLKSFGYRQNAVEFVLEPDNYYFPNQRGNKLVRPQSVSDEKIPVMALEPCADYVFEPVYLHDQQRVALMLAGYDDTSIRNLDERFRRLGNESLTIGPKAAGKNTVSLLRTADTNGKNIQARPGLVVNTAGPEGSVPDVHAEVLLHEVVHLTQGLSDPIFPDELTLRLKKEFEAYAVQATLARSWSMPYSKSSQKAGAVELTRRRYMGESQYEPDEHALEYVRRDEVTAQLAVQLAHNEIIENTA